MPKCTILVGVPGSGKSTWIKEHMPLANVMSTDTIIENVAHSYGMTYDEGFKELISFAEKVMWRRMTWSIAEQVDFVIDRTNMTAKGRKKFIDYIKPFGYEFEAVVFTTPDQDEWERRLNSRPGKTIPKHVLDSMVNSFQMPTEDEGFAKITVI